MKKNKTLRLASCLLIATLCSTCVISGTFAKYVTSDSATDNATVAKWGVTVDVEVDGAFAQEYDATVVVQDANGDDIAKTVASATNNLVAPGTAGNLATLSVEGTPEVAVNVTYVADLELTDWEVSGDWDSDGNVEAEETNVYYCPVVITVNTTAINGLDYASADLFEEAVEGAINKNVNYAPNSTINDSITVTWAWAFEVDNAKDTALGDKTTDLDTISFELTATVTQID